MTSKKTPLSIVRRKEIGIRMRNLECMRYYWNIILFCWVFASCFKSTACNESQSIFITKRRGWMCGERNSAVKSVCLENCKFFDFIPCIWPLINKQVFDGSKQHSCFERLVVPNLNLHQKIDFPDWRFCPM